MYLVYNIDQIHQLIHKTKKNDFLLIIRLKSIAINSHNKEID
jgi:hypothetical protein